MRRAVVLWFLAAIEIDTIFTDGDCTWRHIADDDEAFNWQHTLTELGFDGTEDVDYYTPQEIE
jgi:hypothetical protein